jgi:hypothetical protein
MNVRPLVLRRVARRHRHFRRRQLIDDVGRMRCIGFGRLFDHVSKDATRLPVKRIVIDNAGIS